MSGWLASIATLAEAHEVLAAGANIVDCKDPLAGALGALPEVTVSAVVAAVAGRVPVSATVGDFPGMAPLAVTRAVAAMAKTGVDYVKIGLFPSPQLLACLAALEPVARRHALVAVLFADRQPDFSLVPRLALAGFRGVMLDTAEKRGGGLRAHQPLGVLGDFVRQARQHRLMSGLAGSLRLADIDALLPLGPDYLGFRGALCTGQRRTAALCPAALTSLAARMALAKPPIPA